jgi:hypothetical protein
MWLNPPLEKWISQKFSDFEKLLYVGEICSFEPLDLLQISSKSEFFHSFCFTGPTTKCCRWSNVSTSCALQIAQHGPQELKMMMRQSLKG